MKKNSIYMLLILFAVYNISALAQSQIFRLKIPGNPENRYGKSPYDSPPFPRFTGSSQQFWVESQKLINEGFTSDVNSAFNIWSSSGYVNVLVQRKMEFQVN